ncbi:hypothetical protein BN8_00429 [Fibrisoma limi BUZ 3]|uniref:Outer membrane protein beta-barrel domain-containing protein n=1 Tax=Fibrisoma limi BUZ 3 TaxID=1185876 RepID=I2GC77_9BACT|nr:outer membrane beta-barrel protein [Fibrisoma limi]CCH51501.1 hypothetical protein BN8_00429 [Fibrisoma limi BUZ 3]
MRKTLLILLFLNASLSYAQFPLHKNSVRATVDYMTLSNPEDAGLRFSVQAARHFLNDRFVIAASLGYLTYSTDQQTFTDVPLGQDQRTRLTGDLTFLYDFLPSNRHALRAGAGPSLWYRDDDVLTGYYLVRLPDGSLATTSVQRERQQTNDFGYHLTVEYEYLIKPNISLHSRIGYADLVNGGISGMAGLGVGYRFSFKKRTVAQPVSQ